ncbi:MAG: DUF2723 domain-containing protein [Chloroflexia bacterium]
MPFALGTLIFALAAALYARTLAPSVLPGDYAEFQMCAAVLGVPHPTGYPLYILLGKLFTLLPVGDVAYRVNLSSAMYMAGAAALLYASAARLATPLWPQAGRWTALAGAIFFAISPTVWSMALVARSYALNALLVAAVVFSLISWRSTARPRWFYSSCALIGLSLVHHGTTYLLLPAYALYLLLIEIQRKNEFRAEGHASQAPDHKSKIQNPGTLWVTKIRYALGALAFLAGLSPILFLVHRFLGGSPYYWGNPATWKDFFNLLTGGPFHNQVMGFGWGAQLERIAFGLNELATQYTIPGILLGILGLVVLWRTTRPEALLLTLMLAGNFFFAMNYALVGYLYFIPTYLIFGILIAVGLAWLGQSAAALAANRDTLASNLLKALAAACILTLAAFTLVTRYPGIDQSAGTDTRDTALALLAAAPQGASIYLDWEDVSVIRFYRMVYGMRPDITLHTGDPADWAKGIYCDLASGVPAYIGKFAGAVPPIISRDFTLQPGPMASQVLKVTDAARYEVPPCGLCATCR